MSDVYGSVIGEPVVGMKALGTAASAFGVYQGGKAISRMFKSRKSKVLPESKPLTNLQKQKFVNFMILRLKLVLFVVVLVFVIMRVLIKKLVRLSLVGIVLRLFVMLLKALNMVSVVLVVAVFVFVNII